MQRYIITALTSFLLLIQSGCSVNPVSGQQDFVLMSEDQELALGRKYHAEIINEYGRYNDPELAAYVQRIGDEVAEKSHRNDLVYRFTVLDSPEVNAFALPGGYIYITRGILAYLNSEAELAAVLGHEIGHVTARHSVRRHSTETVTGILGGILASQTGIQVAGDAVNLLGTALVRGYGREHELEADRLGAEYLARSGYNPKAMTDIVHVLKDQEEFEKELAQVENRKAHSYHGLFSTHPANDTRLQNIIRESKKFLDTANLRPDNRDLYLKQIDGLMFGEKAKEGFLRGRHFYHADLDFTVQFPQGWRVKNHPERLLATAPGNDGLLEVSVHDRNRRISPEAFMQKRMQLDDLRSGESFTHHGMQGFTAIADADTEYGKRPARFTVIYKVDRAYVIAGTAKSANQPYKYDDAILSTARSFRGLTDEEWQKMEPLRLRVKTSSGEKFASLAEHSSLNHLAESQLRLLNARYPSGEPAYGSLIKIVE
ncbi:MAG: peptidase M48 [Gammaproteobacteria bacterium]|nr:MAG: peptidase M48 [Gammaproteobacteria bacterium]